MKKILTTLMLFSAAVAFATDTVEVRITNQKGEKSVKTIELKDMGKGIERLHIDAGCIPIDATKIDIVHQYGKAKKGDEGYWVFPNGAMGTFRLDKSHYKLNKTPLQLYGVKTKNKTFAAIVKSMMYEYDLIVDVKNGEYEIVQSYNLKEMGYHLYDPIIVDFYDLKGDDANYSGMARAYRKYQLDRGAVKTIKERIKNQPHLKYASEAPEIRIRQGWKPVPAKVMYQTVANEPPMKPVVTFDRVCEIIDELKSKGVEKAELCLVGWNISGHDGRYPQIFPVEPKLGGEEKLRKLIKKAQEAGYLIVCHTNSTDSYTIADTFSENIVCKNVDGSLQKNAVWSGGRMHNVCAQIAWNHYAKYDLKKVRDLGFDGLYYIDVVSNVPPYDCHDSMHPLNRKQYCAYMNTIMSYARGLFGGIASEGPYDHVAKNLDYVLYTSFNLMRQQPVVTDRVVPLWQIVYNGIILSNPTAETTNYTLKDAKTQLKQIEFGGRPAFYYHSAFRTGARNWMGDIDLRCQSKEEFDNSIEALKRAWDEFSALKHLQLEFMDSHEEIAKDVFVTRWANGDEIVSNYTDKDFEYKGKTVKPMKYVLLKDGK